MAEAYDRSDVGSARGSAVVTPHDTNTFRTARALFVGTGGNIKVKMPDGSTPTFTNVPSGYQLDVQCYMVYATGTTASNIIALY